MEKEPTLSWSRRVSAAGVSSGGGWRKEEGLGGLQWKIHWEHIVQDLRNDKVDGYRAINLPGAEGTSGPAMPRCAKAPVVCWRGSGEVGRTVGEKALVVGEEGRKTESSPQVREVSGRSIGEF